eukprot:CAMPEP_0183738848 /NCGR_PEP_ID=MMETSP0737-20130205/55598_1 /TAXON_ID=385413 /ORGANISM="Thalassiosira miniscula, Strain CCMP1093" /LENGTH=618 /DNA_ID=CAMNT_0025973489 /DNA_START=355 /DNA_END=2208 /DNA_ORIENTATION=-
MSMMQGPNRRQLFVFFLVAASLVWSFLIVPMPSESKNVTTPKDSDDKSRGLMSLEIRHIDHNSFGYDPIVIPNIGGGDISQINDSESVANFMEMMRRPAPSTAEPNFGVERGDPFANVEYNAVYLGNGGNTGGAEFGRGEHFDAHVNDAHAVKCCSRYPMARPGPSWSKKVSQESMALCPYSYDISEDECALMSFREANEFCATKGGRLCTPEELHHRCAVGNGCGADMKFVWTHDSNIDDEIIHVAPRQDNAAPAEIVGHPLIHVFSPHVDRSTKTFAPLNLSQWTMLVSAKRSRDAYNRRHQNVSSYSKFDSVILVCAILQIDEYELRGILSHYCDRVIVLPRSTADEYPNLKPLPFAQDVVDAGKSIMEGGGDFHLMLTNSDICPTEKFYQYTETLLRLRKSEAMAINRATIDTKNLELPANTASISTVSEKHGIAAHISEQAQDAIKQGKFKPHPGHDCFAIHSSVLDMINFGKVFLGYPRWAGSVNKILGVMVDKYEAISPPKTYGTFHLDDERAWNTSDAQDTSFWKEFDRQELEYLYSCPFAGESFQPAKNVHTLQNLINCGKWFQSRTVNGNSVPGFVQPGYEDVYLSKTAGHTELLFARLDESMAVKLW